MSHNPQRHLTEDDFIGFVLEELPEELAQKLDRHLEHCVACAQQLEDFYTAQEKFPAEEWARERNAFVSRLRQQIFGPGDTPPWWDRLRTFLESFSYPLALQQEFFAPREPLDVESEDRAFGLFLVEEDNGDVTVRTDSSEMELAGARIRFSAGEWQRIARLDKVAEDRVGAEVIISRKEREALPPGTLLRAEPVREAESSLISV